MPVDRGLALPNNKNKEICKWTPIQAGSHFLYDVETRYAVIELEMVTICWAITKCS